MNTSRLALAIGLASSLGFCRTLVIGDSLSEGTFGKKIIAGLAEYEEACLYSYSGSNMNQWNQGNFSKARDPIVWQWDAKKRRPRASRPNGKPNWNLAGLLDNPSTSGCGVTGSYDRLVVQLGNNPAKNPEAALRNMVEIARKKGINRITFVLPPPKRAGKVFKNYNEKMRKQIASIISNREAPGVLIDAFDSTQALAVVPKDYRDSEHFRDGSKTQDRWANKILNHLNEGRMVSLEPSGQLPGSAVGTPSH